MSHHPRRLIGALLSLSLLLVGCDMLSSAPLPTPGATTTTDGTPEPTRRPRRTPQPQASGGVSGVDPTPRRTRRPRPTTGASVAPTPTPPPTPPPTPMPPIGGFDEIAGSDGRLTLLLLGSDARGDLAGERTDTMMVATIDPSTGRIAMVSLPRDTVNVPIGDGSVFSSPDRINGLFQHYQGRGASREEALRRVTRAMAYAFDTEIDAYALVKFTGVRKLIDAIGGVDVRLARPLIDPSMKRVSRRGLRLKAGINHLDGTKALAFARTRKADSDYQRAARQQQLLVATTARVLEVGPDAIPALATMAFRHLETDLPPSALPVLVELAGRARLRNPRSVVLAPGTYAGAGPVQYTIQLRLDAVRGLFDRLFGPV